MSDESFLARWSRRKRAARAPESIPPSERDGPHTGDGETGRPPAGTSLRGFAEPGAIKVPLPPVDAIEAGSDIRAFLAPGVPPALTQAALRRAWSADPTIRDFVGLSENSWDFTAPDGVPGFGPITPEEVRRVAARLLGEEEEADAEPPVASAIQPPPPADAEIVPLEGGIASEANPASSIAAVQHAGSDGKQREERPRRRHGGALPQ